MARKVDELKRLPALCEENYLDSELYLGEVKDVLNEEEIIIQPMGREEILVDIRQTDVFYNSSGEKLSKLTLEDPDLFLVTINFKENKVFLVERDLTTEPEKINKSVTFNLDDCEDLQEESEPEPIFLSENNSVVPVDVDVDPDVIVDVDDVEGEDEDYSSKEAEARANSDLEDIISALIGRIDKLEVDLQEREAEFIRETEKYMKEKAKFNVTLKEKEKKIHLLDEDLKTKESLIMELSSALWQNN